MATITITPGNSFTPNETVTSTKLNDLGSPTAALTAGSIGTADIADANVTFAKLTDVIDDDTMATATATTLATSESIKAYVDTQSSIISPCYPIGSIYINAINSNNPSNLLGFGTWVAFGAGRVPVGIDPSQPEFDAAEEEGGAKTHTLTTNEIPSHSHNLGTFGNNSSAGSSIASSSLSNQPTQDTTATGGGQSHNNLQPYIVVYMWKRTA